MPRFQNFQAFFPLNRRLLLPCRRRVVYPANISISFKYSTKVTTSTPLLPEFSLAKKVILVSGAARGLGLTQAEALLEAGATVYALDRLPEPSSDFPRVVERAKQLGTALHYRQIDVRDEHALEATVAKISGEHGGIDGLIAAAGIQQETPALEYTAADCGRMFDINVTGVFMTAKAVAKEMVKTGRGGSIVLIASMSGTVANRVSHDSPFSCN